MLSLKQTTYSLFLGCLVTCKIAAAQLHPDNATPKAMPEVEFGIDRSNMATEWTLSPPAEPNIHPFNGPYNGAGIFEARRIAVFDGIASLHPQWFRDGFGGDTPTDIDLFVDTVTQVHARGIKMLAVIGHAGSDFDPKDFINPKDSGCQWGTFPLSKINLTKLEHRLRAHFDALKTAGVSVDAFEVDNELDLYCNDADVPKTSEFAAHHWQWFLSKEQVHAFAAGYAPYLKTFATVIREYFPHAKIITCGMSNPTGNSAALILALANFTDASGKTFDYTTLVDGYGSHIYLPSDTTLGMITRATEELTSQAAILPHIQQKPIWITEWNESASAFWSSHKWYFQPTQVGHSMVDLNHADPKGTFPAMTRVQVIEAFQEKVINHLRSQPNPINIGPLLYYSYDSAGKSDMCDKTVFNTSRGIKGTCFNGLIDPVTGDLLPDVAAALTFHKLPSTTKSQPTPTSPLPRTHATLASPVTWGSPDQSYGKRRSVTPADRAAIQIYHSGIKAPLYSSTFTSNTELLANWNLVSDDIQWGGYQSCRRPSNVETSGTGLRLKTLVATDCHHKWSTGSIISKAKYGPYGFFEATMKIADIKGMNNAFWMTTEDNPEAGDHFEIDASEVQFPSYDHIGLQQYPAKGNNFVKHSGMGWGANFADNLSSGFHDYGVLWTPTEMVFEIDGEPVAAVVTNNSVRNPTDVALSTALIYAGIPDHPEGHDMLVQSVRIFALQK